MKTKLVFLAAGLMLSPSLNGYAQTISWSGAADGSSWKLAGNWAGGVLPGVNNDVVITAGAGTTVTIASGNLSVKSLQCSKNLTLSGGSLTLTAGGSQVGGALSLSGGASIAVHGTSASFTANGPTTAVDAGLSAIAGGVLRLPNLKSATNNASSTTWKADGPGSVLDLSSVTNLGVSYYERLYLQALNGGSLDLHQVGGTAGAVQVTAEDTGSVVDLSGLSGRWSSRASGAVGLEAQGGASILIPNVTQLEYASLRIDDTGAIPTAQLNLLTNVDLTVDGASPDFGGVTNIDDTGVAALNGGAARLTNVTRVVVGAQSVTWKADGAGSLADLSRVNSLSVNYYQRLYLDAYNGGSINVHRLNNPTSAIRVDAEDADSVVDLSGITGRWKSQASGALGLEAQGGASILIPNVTQLEYASLRIDYAGVIPTAQLDLLTNVDLTVDGSSPNFGGVTNIDDTTVTALNGGLARLTNVTGVVVGAQSVTWKADGAGSLADLSRVTSVNVNYYQRLYLDAYNGGTVDVRRLNGPTSAILVDAEDSDSVVDLSGITGRWKSQASGAVGLEAQGGASILIPNVTQLENASLRIDNTGAVPTAQLDLLTNVDLTVDGCSPDFGRVTNVDDTSVTVLNGGVARLTNVTGVVVGAQSVTWKADGAGSLADLSRVTSLNVNYYQRLYLDAYNGGTVDVHRLNNCNSAILVDAEDSDSVVDLSGITGRWKSQASGAIGLEAQGGGSILIPNVSQLENASLRIDDTGFISTAQLNLLTNVDLTVDGSEPDFGLVTNIDDSAISALNGGIARLTNVTRMVVGSQSVTWKADGSGSLVDLSSLVRVAVAYYQRLYVQAYDGGSVDLSHLQSLSTGSVQILADGSGSVVQIEGLSSFISVGSGDSSLTARNGGQVQLGSQAFLLANVAISIPPGDPVLPPTLVASSSLALYGSPWHSYWIDKRDTQQPDSPWTFALRVPLLSAFQTLAPAPPPDTEFRVWDFIADPPLLDLFALPGHRAQPILYGIPSQNYQVLSSPSINSGAAWQPGPGGTVAMTNAFRFLNPIPATDSAQFFRAKKL